MGLYNALFGVDQACGMALDMLCLNGLEVPRFRDAYFAWADPETRQDPVIVVLTRTGGGNREDYASTLDALHFHADFLSEVADEFDPTYALFTFAVPAQHRSFVTAYLEMRGQPKTLREKFEGVVAAMARREE